MHIHVPHINQEPFSNSQKQLTVNYSVPRFPRIQQGKDKTPTILCKKYLF